MIFVDEGMSERIPVLKSTYLPLFFREVPESCEINKKYHLLKKYKKYEVSFEKYKKYEVSLKKYKKYSILEI